MKSYELNKAVETSPKVIGLRTPHYLFAMALLLIGGVIAMVSLKSMLWALIISVGELGAYGIMRYLSADSRMDIRTNNQPSRIEGYRDDGL